VHQGMLSRTQIDFGTTVSEQYKLMLNCKNASTTPANNAVPNVTPASQSVTEASNGVALMDLVNLIGEMSVERNKCDDGTAKIGIEDEGENADDVIALDMHRRLVKRATAQYNDMIDNAYEEGDDDEKKRKRKKVSKNLNSLKKAKKESRHLDNVKCVTRNCEKLRGDNKMSSQDVLDRMQIIFNDEEE